MHGVAVLQGGKPPFLHKRGGDADGNVHIPGFNPVCNVFNHTACLHRQ